jgi:hypothetical protein
MPIYDKPTKVLMTEWAKQHLSPAKTFGRAEPVKWFAEHYPKIKAATVRMHVDGMSVNNLNRRHPFFKPVCGHYLFFKLGPDLHRLWNPQTDPPPRYKEAIEAQPTKKLEASTAEDEAEEEQTASVVLEYPAEVRSAGMRLINNTDFSRSTFLVLIALLNE